MSSRPYVLMAGTAFSARMFMTVFNSTGTRAGGAVKVKVLPRRYGRRCDAPTMHSWDKGRQTPSTVSTKEALSSFICLIVSMAAWKLGAWH